MRYILITILIFLSSQCLGKEITFAITKIANFETKIIEDKKVYTGNILWTKNNQPAVVRIMLIGTSSSTPFDETITNKDGSFRLTTSKEVYSLILIQPANKRKLLIPPKEND